MNVAKQNFSIPLSSPALVRASAGTGKTYQLAVRYISIAAKGEDLSKILATTFTRKAAGEIFSRVLERVAEATTNDHARAQLALEIEQENWSKQAAEELLVRLVRAQHRIKICTLDSLFFSFASVFALELGLPPKFTIADPALKQHETLENLRTLLSASVSKDFVNLVRRMNPDPLSRLITKPLTSAALQFFDLFRESEKSAWFWIKPPPPLNSAELESLQQSLESFEIKNANWAKTVKKLAALVASKDWTNFVNNKLTVSTLEGQTYYKLPTPSPLEKTIRRLVDHARSQILSDLKRQTEGCFEFLARFSESYKSRIAETGKLSFDDAKEILALGALTGRLEDLYYRLDGQIHHLLFDEFQDTALSQWAVLEPIADEILSKIGGGNIDHSFFCVGDVKQAIYGWRGGVAEIFDTLTERWDQLDSYPMDQTRRCSPIILDAVNQTFLKIGSNPALKDFDDVAMLWQNRFSTHQAIDPDKPGYVELIKLPKEEDSGSRKIGTYRAAAVKAKELLELNPGLSIGILLRNNSSLKLILRELSKPEVNITASEESGNPITDSSAVMAVLSLLKLLDHPSDSVCAYHVSNSPLGVLLGFTDLNHQKQLSQMLYSSRQKISAAGLGAFLTELTHALAPEISGHDRYRLEQLIELALTTRNSAARFSDFIRLAEDLRREDPNASRVRVMTIHAAKGLEFDAVILPDLSQSIFKNGKQTHWVARNTNRRPERIVIAPNSAATVVSADLKAMKQAVRNDSALGDLSVLYVAMTRAKHGLYLISRSDYLGEGSFAKILQSALGTESSESILQYQHGDPNWAAQVTRKIELVEENAIARLQLKKPQGPKLRGLPLISASSLEGKAAYDVASAFSSGSLAAAKRGKEIHKEFEQIEWLTADSTEYSQSIREILSRERYRVGNRHQVYREQSFAIRQADEMLTGIIDRLVVSYDSDKAIAAEVIDFKTDQIASSEIEKRTEYYKPQLDLYRKAVAHMFRLDLASITSSIVFSSLNQVRKVS